METFITVIQLLINPVSPAGIVVYFYLGLYLFGQFSNKVNKGVA
jgi:hypothetical protein